MEKKEIWLVTLPHAGGSSVVFKRWKKKVACNILNVEYPGHWTRMNEPMIDTFEQLADDVVNTIEKNIPYGAMILLFGHSVGAIISWYISPVLIDKGYNVCELFLSGSQCPGSFPEKSILKSVTDSQMLRMIGYKTEEHNEVINKQFMDIFFPILKNDLKVCKSFLCDGHFVGIRSYVLYGTEDIFTEFEEVRKWEDYVSLVSLNAYCGDHLFIDNIENFKGITDLINDEVQLLNNMKNPGFKDTYNELHENK